MNSGPLTRFRGICAATVATSRKCARAGFEGASKSIMAGVVVSTMAVAQALDLPFDEAIRFFRQKAAVTTKSHRDVWDAAHAKMFMVAGANTQAIVDDFQEAIAKALEKGTTLEEFRKDFDRIVKTHGWSYRGERGWRTRTIFETNLSTAYAAGRYAKLTAPDTLATFPYWRYNHSGALHPRLQHKAWDGDVYVADDPFWTVAFPPNGYGCGCFVTPVSRAGLKRLGKTRPDTAPDLSQPGSDQPVGVDPSFAYNPGEAWLRQTAPGPKAVSAIEASVAGFVRSALAGKRPDGSWTPVAIADDATAAVLDVPIGTEVRLSADTIRSHVHHDLITPESYGVLPRELAQHGRLLTDKTGRWAFVGQVDGRLYQAGIKVVKKATHKEIWLVSLRRTERRNISKNFGIEWE